MCRGEARASQVPGPSSSCVPWSNTPPDTFPSSPVCRRGALLPSMESSTLGIREDIGFGAAVPRPARSSAYASPAVSPRPAQGWLPAWAGSPLAGQDSHLLDDKQSFMKASHPPIPFDPQGLVALKFLSAIGSFFLNCLCCIMPLCHLLVSFLLHKFLCSSCLRHRLLLVYTPLYFLLAPKSLLIFCPFLFSQ